MDNNSVCFKFFEWTRYLPKIYTSQSHADVTLVCEGKKILLHRSVLASISPFFNELLSNRESSVHPPVILLEGFKYSVLVLLVNFFYCGSIEGSSDDIVTLSKYAKELCVKGIVSGGSSTRPLKLELLERKTKVNEQLQKLQQSNDSDSVSSSSDEEDDLQVVYQRKVDDYKTDRVETTAKTAAHNQFRNAPKSKRSISPCLVPTQEKKSKVLPEQSLSTSAGVTAGESSHSQTAPLRVIRCSICKEMFATKLVLKTHLQTFHSEILTCTICDKLFSARMTLKKHLKNHIAKLDGLIGSTPILPSNAVIPEKTTSLKNSRAKT